MLGWQINVSIANEAWFGENEWMNEFIFFHFKLQKLLSQVTNILDAQAPPDIKNSVCLWGCVSFRQIPVPMWNLTLFV